MDIRTTGLKTVDGQVVERRSQDVEPIIEHAANLRAVGAVGGSEMRHAARIPFALIENYLQVNGINMHEFQTNPAHIKRMLNDPALAHFRIWQGRV
jgi:hypothetical protein